MEFNRNRAQQTDKQRKAFTLVEVLIALTLVSSIFAASSSMMIMFIKMERSMTTMTELEQQNSNFRKWFSRDMREAKMFRITNSQEVQLKLRDESHIIYYVDPGNSSQLLRSVNGSPISLIRDLSTINFSFNDADEKEVLASVSLSRPLQNEKNVETNLSTIFVKRN